VRWKHAIRNHVFCALRAFLHLEANRSRGLIAPSMNSSVTSLIKPSLTLSGRRSSTLTVRNEIQVLVSWLFQDLRHGDDCEKLGEEV